MEWDEWEWETDGSNGRWVGCMKDDMDMGGGGKRTSKTKGTKGTRKGKRLGSSKQTKASTTKSLKRAEAEREHISQELGKASRAQNRVQLDLERLRSRRHEALQRALVDEVDLPRKVDGDRRGDGRRRRGRRGESENKEEDDDTDAASTRSSSLGLSQDSSMDPSSQDTETSDHFSQGDSKVVRKDAKAAGKIDFSGLPESLRQQDDAAMRRRQGDTFSRQLHEIASAIERMQPNLKAEEQFSEATQRAKQTKSDCAAARQTLLTAARDFGAVKRRRATLFNDMYEAVKENIMSVYKELTRSSKHPDGGQAYLSLEDEGSDEPYLSGIAFTAMPPTKRFRTMASLSGGEKTISALALLFTIHKYKPSPFFVMDEIDAALDNVNIAKIATFLDNQAQRQAFQSVVISLKENLYSRAFSLVGVSRDPSAPSKKDRKAGGSQTITADMLEYHA